MALDFLQRTSFNVSHTIPNSMPPTTEPVRIDKWLWAVRLYKTRTQAADACRLSAVRIGGQEVKASREVRLGDVIEVRQPDLTRTVKVVGLLQKRVGPKLVVDFLEDLTPPEVYAAARELRQQRALAPPVAPLLKPSKRDRRMLERFFHQAEERDAKPDCE